MSLKRGSVFGVLISSLLMVGTVDAWAQGVPGRVTLLQVQVEQALAKIAELQAALAAEASARQAADTSMQTAISGLSRGGVTQAALDAAIASESSARSEADTVLQAQLDADAADRAALDVALAPLTSLAQYVTVDTGIINDLAGPHVIFTGANLHIRSGHFSSNSYVQNGVGNLILGYNEPSDPAVPAERSGSHNLVVGPNHRYNFGVGLIVGGSSRLGNDGASVSGGFLNSASGLFSNVSAGLRNEAVGDFAAVSGGADNIASGNTAAASAGQMNQATGDLSSVMGGFNNAATAVLSTVGGGANQTNATPSTFVP